VVIRASQMNAKIRVWAGPTIMRAESGIGNFDRSESSLRLRL
jgi:hypothetical protein